MSSPHERREHHAPADQNGSCSHYTVRSAAGRSLHRALVPHTLTTLSGARAFPDDTEPRHPSRTWASAPWRLVVAGAPEGQELLELGRDLVGRRQFSVFVGERRAECRALHIGVMPFFERADELGELAVLG